MPRRSIARSTLRAADLRVNTLCPCDGCQQSGNLKIKLVGHVGGVAMQKVKQLTELAGVDVIVVHRMLKNNVPVPEYLLMTEPVHALVGSPLRERAAPLRLDLDDLGPTRRIYLDLDRLTDALPPPRKLPPLAPARTRTSASACARSPTSSACASPALAFATFPTPADRCGRAVSVLRAGDAGRLDSTERRSQGILTKFRAGPSRAAAHARRPWTTAPTRARPAHICLGGGKS